MRRLLVNDALNQLGEVTLWTRLQEWFNMEFVGGDYATLADLAKDAAKDASLIIRNATWFPPIDTRVPTISLLQDISPDGETRKMQEAVIKSSSAIVFNSEFTKSHYTGNWTPELKAQARAPVIPLPVDFSLFTPQNAMGCQQALSLPDGCICWIGASQGAAGHVKGWDILVQIARLNPDLNFVCVLKDAMPESCPPNMRCYVKLTHAELVKVIGACRVGLCTSRTESQHLAGIEMGAVGLPIVAPPVGIYWQRDFQPWMHVVNEKSDFTTHIRACLAMPLGGEVGREYWQREFDIPVVRAQWEKLVKEVECSGQS